MLSDILFDAEIQLKRLRTTDMYATMYEQAIKEEVDEIVERLKKLRIKLDKPPDK